MFEEIKHIDSSIYQLRSFGRTVGIVLLLIGIFQYATSRALFPYFLGIGLLLIVLGLLAPIVLRPIYIVWMSFAVVMGFIMTRVILTLLYFLVLTPIGLLAKISGKQFLHLKPDVGQQSYWNLRDRKPTDPTVYEKQY